MAVSSPSLHASSGLWEAERESNMDWEQEEEKKSAYLREFMYRKERYSRDSEERRRDRPVFIRRMEKLARGYRRGKIGWKDYEKQKEIIR